MRVRQHLLLQLALHALLLLPDLGALLLGAREFSRFPTSFDDRLLRWDVLQFRRGELSAEYVGLGCSVISAFFLVFVGRFGNMRKQLRFVALECEVPNKIRRIGTEATQDRFCASEAPGELLVPNNDLVENCEVQVGEEVLGWRVIVDAQDGRTGDH